MVITVGLNFFFNLVFIVFMIHLFDLDVKASAAPCGRLFGKRLLFLLHLSSGHLDTETLSVFTIEFLQSLFGVIQFVRTVTDVILIKVKVSKAIRFLLDLCRWSLLFASKRWKIIKACQAVASRF
jgi:hypothetical protein